jgi:hypothetical protein
MFASQQRLTPEAQNEKVVDISHHQNKNKYGYASQNLSEEKKDELLSEIRLNKMRWWNVFNINLTRFRADKLFYTGKLMWDAVAYTNYDQLGKIPYTFNLLKPIVRQLQGEMSSMQPSLTLSPRNHDKVDPSLLILMTDFLRAEMYHHKAADAYNECFLNQCIGGWGVLELGTKYQDEFSFNQDITVTSCADPLLVGFDPAAQVKTKIDSKFQYKDYYMTKEDFRATFNREPPPPGSMLGTYQQFMPLIDSDLVIVTDYYRVEYKTKTLVQLTDHDSYVIDVLEKDIPVAQEHYVQLMTQAGKMMDEIPQLVIVNKRKTKIETIHCYKCVFDDVLEHKIWPSKYMPFVYVDGNSVTQDGKQYTESFINSARDAQMAYNYAMSEIYNGVPRARRETVWLTRTQAKNHEDFLRYPDRQQSHCEYNFDPNVPSGPIFRTPDELPETLFVAATTAKQAVYDALGIMPVNGSELPNNLASATVGRIITQGNLTFAKLLNNLFDAMQQLGETFLDLVPKIYDVERIVNIVDATGSTRTAAINTIENGQPKNMLSDFVYHLEVKPLASFAIQQQELRQNLMQLAALEPQNPPLMSDLIAGTFETPIAPLLVKRLSSLVPPNVLAAERGEPPPPPAPPPPAAQMQMANVHKAEAQATLAESKASETQQKQQIAMQNLELKNQELHEKTQVEQLKILQANNETNAKTQQATIHATAEIHKANLDHHVRMAIAQSSPMPSGKALGAPPPRQ